MSRLARLGITGALVALAGVSASACLRRDVSTEQPTTKISFDTIVRQPAVTKVDLLLMVDNSASMADKQRILADALPDLVRGLVQPRCVDAATGEPTGTLADPLVPETAMCPAGSEPAFPPITDMHVGVIDSSLGGLGSASCAPAEAPANDDRAHLLSRGEKGPVAATGDLGFLAWYPDVEANADKLRHPDPPVPKTKSLADLDAAFRDLVLGVGQSGCGLEAQLESVYRFLVQPDPWVQIARNGDRATYGAPNEVDVELLRQRAAFLRPDSLVAVIVLTDEDDSSADPLSFEGTGWVFMQSSQADPSCPGCGPRQRGTAACATRPSDPACTSCFFVPQDASCTANGGRYTAEEDPLNVRFHRMKQRFGVDPQFPIQRYVDGLSKAKVPRRDAEHDVHGSYRPGAECTNPLFAAHLPTEPGDELCKLARGPRSTGLVYFAVIGGVPNQLLPDGADEKIDWTRILGRDPSAWDETGIDPHMLQSIGPRRDLPPVGSPDDADPVHGREWDTKGTDLQFACTFDLYERMPDGTTAPLRRPCEGEPALCDCDGTKDTPLCAPNDRAVQIRGKAYPTRRELMVVKDLGEQGIAASLCPKQLTAPNAPDYGYRPAIRAITRRIERGLGSCLPRSLVRQPDGTVSCIVTAILPDEGPDSDCQKRYGLESPAPALTRQLRERLVEDEGPAAARLPICEIPQIAVPTGATCKDAEETGFCYAERAKGASCASALVFTKSAQRLENARFSMQCIQLTGSN